MHPSPPVHLARGGTSVVVDASTAGLPSILYWGPALGESPADELDALAAASVPQRVSGSIDIPARLTLIPQEAHGWQGTPGFTGQRGGGFLTPAFQLTHLTADDHQLTIEATDDDASLALRVQLTLTEAGLLRQRLAVTNTGADEYEVRSLLAFFPLPANAQEVLDHTGRHLRERSPQRHNLTTGSYHRESRRGRPGADATVLVAAGETAFGFERGQVHAAHTAWSGNHQYIVEQTPSGDKFLACGELLLPQEMALAPGATYTAPDAIGSWGDGLNELASRFHAEFRSRPEHPVRPRPVTLNTWEAVYFDHDLATLKALADRAAQVGIERYVLDDGWFSGRRDDTAGLGDWFIDGTVWPDGLTPLINHVRSLGMEFGLWFEPEMVNPDSKLARNHPEWIVQTPGRLPVAARQQQVLNLAIPDAYDYILTCIDDVLRTNDIAYIKWDHNRDLLEAADAISGAAVVHSNVLAVYRLMAELKERHPGLEIESCASGGARVDMGILRHTDRIWTSDCIDPIERLVNQKHTGLLVPPELMGMHVGGPRSHSTGRTHTLPFRAATAIFGHFGVEWDISGLSAEELGRLGSWINLHKRWRDVLHTGTTVHADLPDPSMDLRGVVASDKRSALYGYSLTGSSASYPPGRITFPGLDPATTYTIAPAAYDYEDQGQSGLAWVEAARNGAPLAMSGRILGAPGVQAPVLFPEQSVLIEVRAHTPERHHTP
ncbi:alpha-galactosidase [Arthrobacter tumbae]|uniref:alpha-galactosidase n=1 Tax=Arthrobacter tumbae TaxID=163874 RepID=UPI0019581012|nr:alpha-galactosidase [Arthrobacter tumbae]MBM7780096.1 alpha-galactosidase [Arthrobacter tumbae]